MRLGLGLGLPSKPHGKGVQFPSTSLIAYWNFSTIGETTADRVSGSELYQLRFDDPENPITFDVEAISGKIGNGAYFYPNDPVAQNGVQVRYLANDTFSPSLSVFSVAAWIKVGSSTGFRQIAGKWDGGGYQFFFGLTGDSYPIFIIGDSTGGVTEALTLSTAVDNNQWHLVVATMNANDSVMKLSLDNSEFIFTTASNACPTSTRPLEVGGNQAQSCYEFNGEIDELAFWNREITQQEVALLWNNGSGITY